MPPHTWAGDLVELDVMTPGACKKSRAPAPVIPALSRDPEPWAARGFSENVAFLDPGAPAGMTVVVLAQSRDGPAAFTVRSRTACFETPS
ncbi:hypothetical protein [Chenggangzhangella methanolivorans]|uniref:Uncharacterized protein n=1 Tax=Chenggangzhangella methanolivorans TaxID=1437009 RepID=A0A9E6RBD2_9HYPH|nr:hypothetical protein [Chenggangzhangella methanolivorans]QZO00189.1 hypothetical protein K6K41_27305 [Chenggangzhangella methanolivorans]